MSSENVEVELKPRNIDSIASLIPLPEDTKSGSSTASLKTSKSADAKGDTEAEVQKVTVQKSSVGLGASGSCTETDVEIHKSTASRSFTAKSDTEIANAAAPLIRVGSNTVYSTKSDTVVVTNVGPPVNVITSVGSTVCRICHTNTANENLISPCYCKGSLAYVHLSCLERWLNQSSRSYCELCMYRYNAVETQRYGLCEGLRLWIRHPRNRSHVQSDIIISVLLTIVTIGLVLVCLMGMHYFMMEGNKLGISNMWTKSAICFFLAIVLLGYTVTVYLLVRDQVVPWYHWWKNTVDVRLMLTPSITSGIRRQVNDPPEVV